MQPVRGRQPGPGAVAHGQVKSRQESQLELLAADQQRLDYEDVARVQLDAGALPQEPQPEAPVIEIGPAGATARESALAGPRSR